MANVYRGTRLAAASVHCDQLARLSRESVREANASAALHRQLAGISSEDSPAPASGGPSFSAAVKRSHLFGSSSGTLVITSSGITYQTTDRADVRRWSYPNIKQLQIRSPRHITVLTFEDQGWLKFGADRRFDFELIDGTVTPEMVALIVARTDRALVSAVLPPLADPPLFRVPVKHERHARGSEGVLLMYDDALVYRTERTTEARYWRYTDLFAVLPLDRDRLQVIAYEGGAGALRPFTFQLKSPMPDAFTHALWARINPPAPLGGQTATGSGGRADNGGR